MTMSDEHSIFLPSYSSRSADEFVEKYKLYFLRDEIADISIENGDLALTKDHDIRLGCQRYSALSRLAEYWRHTEPHINHLYRLCSLMADRQTEVMARVDEASRDSGKGRAHGGFSQEFLEVWNAHWDQEGAAHSGRQAYAGCIMVLASHAIKRFRDDIECSRELWESCGTLHSGHSVGELVTASANGFRHGYEWARAFPPTRQQELSMKVIRSALAGSDMNFDENGSPGRCEEILKLVSKGDLVDGFTSEVMSFAHDITISLK